jgi:DNA ligase-1
MLAHNYVHGAPIGGWYASEKLDGMRAFWDGGITRGMACSAVPFANTAKDGRYVVPPKSTGLWSRYGKSIQAPDWWLDLLPSYPLDGELYCGRNGFQTLMSTVKDLNPGPGWKQVKYLAFDMPAPHVVFSDGEINETNFKKKFVHLLSKLKKVDYPFTGVPQYRHVVQWMKGFKWNEAFEVLYQTELPPMTSHALQQALLLMDDVTSKGGEGIMLRSPTSCWLPNRVRTLLKLKEIRDAEGTVTGYTAGRETELGSKLLGMMGALILDFNGKRLELSGFTDAERILDGSMSGIFASEYAAGHPGEDMPDWIENPKFPRGTKVTFRYRELTDDGLPKEARYWRKHESDCHS